MVARLAGDFYPMDAELSLRPRMRRLFWHLTAMWAVVCLAKAVAMFWALNSLSLDTFVLVKSISMPAANLLAVFLTVCAAVLVAPQGGTDRRRRASSPARCLTHTSGHRARVPDPTDWLLTKPERGNPATRLDDQHPGEQAWSEGNLVRPLVHGATYFAELYERIEATRAGDLVFFTDWQGDADERLTGEPGSEVAEVLGRADERGVDVRGLVWRSHSSAIGFTSDENLRLGRALQKRGAEAILDMRVRTGGSPPPEAGRDPAPRRPDPRHRLRRRHRPVPLASRRRRRTAATRRRWTTWPRSTATPRRGTTSRPRSAARPSTTSRPCSGSGGRTPPR